MFSGFFNSEAVSKAVLCINDGLSGRMAWQFLNVLELFSA